MSKKKKGMFSWLGLNQNKQVVEEDIISEEHSTVEKSSVTDELSDELSNETIIDEAVTTAEIQIEEDLVEPKELIKPDVNEPKEQVAPDAKRGFFSRFKKEVNHEGETLSEENATVEKSSAIDELSDELSDQLPDELPDELPDQLPDQLSNKTIIDEAVTTAEMQIKEDLVEPKELIKPDVNEPKEQVAPDAKRGFFSRFKKEVNHEKETLSEENATVEKNSAIDELSDELSDQLPDQLPDQLSNETIIDEAVTTAEMQIEEDLVETEELIKPDVNEPKEQVAPDAKRGFFSRFKKEVNHEKETLSEENATVEKNSAIDEAVTTAEMQIEEDLVETEELIKPDVNEPKEQVAPDAKRGFFSRFKKEVNHEKETLSEENATVEKSSAIDEAVTIAEMQIEEDLVEPKELIKPDVNEPKEQVAPNAKRGFFSRLKKGLSKTRQNLGGGLSDLFRGKQIDDDLFEELETHLLMADVGVETTMQIINSLTKSANRKQLKNAESLYELLKAELKKIIEKSSVPLEIPQSDGPFVMLMVGVNGVGKTTTIGKLAKQFQAQGKSVMLAAGDTFRAAAVEQLQVWGDRNDIPVIAQQTGADSASVIFDAISAAKARNVDVLIADTAGRLQNKAHLMEELKKVVRVMKKLDVNAPHEVMLTLDAGTGQNALSQTKLFDEAVGLTGLTITKLDGTAKGGVIFAISNKHNIPIRYLGVGEGIDDLRPFDGDDFIDALFIKE